MFYDKMIYIFTFQIVLTNVIERRRIVDFLRQRQYPCETRHNYNNKVNYSNGSGGSGVDSYFQLYTTHIRPAYRNFHVRLGSITADSAQYVCALGGQLGITVRQYMRCKHRVNLRHPFLPCAIEFGGNKHRSFYPLELLEIRFINKKKDNNNPPNTHAHSDNIAISKNNVVATDPDPSLTSYTSPLPRYGGWLDETEEEPSAADDSVPIVP